jgi:hypothetical protein
MTRNDRAPDCALIARRRHNYDPEARGVIERKLQRTIAF